MWARRATLTLEILERPEAEQVLILKRSTSPSGSACLQIHCKMAVVVQLSQRQRVCSLAIRIGACQRLLKDDNGLARSGPALESLKRCISDLPDNLTKEHACVAFPSRLTLGTKLAWCGGGRPTHSGPLT